MYIYSKHTESNYFKHVGYNLLLRTWEIPYWERPLLHLVQLGGTCPDLQSFPTSEIVWIRDTDANTFGPFLQCISIDLLSADLSSSFLNMLVLPVSTAFWHNQFHKFLTTVETNNQKNTKLFCWMFWTDFLLVPMSFRTKRSLMLKCFFGLSKPRPQRAQNNTLPSFLVGLPAHGCACKVHCPVLASTQVLPLFSALPHHSLPNPQIFPFS